MEYLNPYSVPERGAIVGIVQTSESDALFPKRHARSMQHLKDCLNCEVRDYTEYSAPLTSTNHAQELADRFHHALEETQLILSLTGGYTTICMLPSIDFDLVRQRRPLVMGYSDTTALLLAILAKSGMATLHGPALLGSFGECPGVNKPTLKATSALISSDSSGYGYTAPSLFTDIDLFWDRDDTLPLPYRPNRPWRSNCSERIEGTLYGGNLSTLLAVANTEYFPHVEGGILFLEDAETSPYRLMRDIESLRQRGVFEGVRGVMIGKFFRPASDEESRRMNDYLLERFRQMGLPAMVDIDFGHCYPHLPIPLGVRACVDYGRCSLTLRESFTRPREGVRSD